jgi:hypothetical protein
MAFFQLTAAFNQDLVGYIRLDVLSRPIHETFSAREGWILADANG